MTNRAHSEANLPRPVALVPVAKPRGKMTSPPSQTTPHHYANQNENRNQNTTNNQIANHHSGLFHCEIFFQFTYMKIEITKDVIEKDYLPNLLESGKLHHFFVF